MSIVLAYPAEQDCQCDELVSKIERHMRELSERCQAIVYAIDTRIAAREDDGNRD